MPPTEVLVISGTGIVIVLGCCAYVYRPTLRSVREHLAVRALRKDLDKHL